MGCLDDAAIQSYVSGGDDDRAAAEAHLDGCDSCRLLVSALASDSPRGQRRRGKAEIGQTIDRYELTSFLGAGGMGVVYAAHDPELKRDVAVKLLHPDSEAGERSDLRARLLREAQAMAQVAHPNVIAVYDVGTWGDEVFIAMELATGGTLRAWCKGRAPRQAIDAYLEAGRGLAAAHAVGLVHRDFKPDNVLVGADGRIRVTDFGLARSHDAPPTSAPPTRPTPPLLTLTVSGTMMGTPGYMASELYDGRPADARTDQFAFCVALWEALYGARPFVGDTETELADAVVGDRIAEPKTRAVPRDVDRVLRRGLAADPAARWPSMNALLAELAPRKRRAWVYAALALVVIGGAAVAWPRAQRHVAVVAADAGVDALDPETARADAEIRAILAREDDDFARGHFADAKHDGADAIARARAHGSPGVLIDALTTDASALKELGQLADAEHELHEAQRIAETDRDDGRKNTVSAALVGVLESEGKLAEASEVRAMTTATAARHGADDAARAAALESQASSLTDIDAAEAKFNEALVIRDRGTLDDRTQNRTYLAGMLGNSGRLPHAREILLANLDAIESRKNADPKDADYSRLATLATLSVTENRLAMWDAAEAHARRHLAIALARLGASAPVAGEGYVALGMALAGKGDLRGARAAIDHALELFVDLPTRRLRVEYTAAGGYYRLHDYHDAVRHMESAVALCSKLSGEDTGTTLTYKVTLAWLLDADRQFARARTVAESVLAHAEAAHLTDGAIGEARFALARALPKSDRAHALAIAEEARTALVRGGNVVAAQRTLLEKWIRDPDVPIDP